MRSFQSRKKIAPVSDKPHSYPVKEKSAGQFGPKLAPQVQRQENSQDILPPLQRVGNYRHISLEQMYGYGQTAPVQAKLAIGKPGDKYEQQADQVATQVVKQINQPSPAPGVQSKEESLPISEPLEIQREEQDEEMAMKPLDAQLQREEQEEEVQMKPLDAQLQREEQEEEMAMKPLSYPVGKPQLQRDALAGETATPEFEGELQQAKRRGQPLDKKLQAKMGAAMGADFSGVRVHTDTQSQHLNQAVQAKAFTTGQDVFFNQGQYKPSSQEGQELIAHELTHVVQQKGAAVQKKNR